MYNFDDDENEIDTQLVSENFDDANAAILREQNRSGRYCNTTKRLAKKYHYWSPKGIQWLVNSAVAAGEDISKIEKRYLQLKPDKTIQLSDAFRQHYLVAMEQRRAEQTSPMKNNGA